MAAPHHTYRRVAFAAAVVGLVLAAAASVAVPWLLHRPAGRVGRSVERLR